MKEKKNWQLIIGSIIIGIVLLLMIISLFYTPYDPTHHNEDILEPPGGNYLLGTDKLGKDVFSRIMTGAQPTFLIAFGTVLIGVIIGTLLGAFAGYFGKWLDEIIMRTSDAFLAFPGMLIALILIMIAGKNIFILIISLGIIFIPSYVKVVRGEFVRYKNLDFVNSARSMGASSLRIMFVHILPNIINQIIPSITIGFSNAMLAEASLSYLGLGVQPPYASWGNMINDAQSNIKDAPWAILAPGIMIIICVIGFNLLAEGMTNDKN